MSYSADFTNLIAVYALVLIVPGLDFAVVLRESLLYGRKCGMFAVLGVSVSVAIHCTYTILGLGLIIAQSPLLFNTVKWLGISYLLYIGVRALLRKVQNSAALGAEMTVNSRPRSVKKAFLAGFACNLLNPKCILFFLSIFSVLVRPSTPLAVKALDAACIVLCCGLWFTCVTFFLTMPKIRYTYNRLGIWIDKMTGVVFIALGISLMFQQAQP